MSSSDYTILKMENISKVFKKRPQLTACISFALAMFVVTASAVAIGIFIGYTYCYLEHHTGFRTGNISHSTNYHVLNLPVSEERKGNRTINGALMSSMLVSKMLYLGHSFLEDELAHVPWHGDDIQLNST